jgi:hypothetical protein
VRPSASRRVLVTMIITTMITMTKMLLMMMVANSITGGKNL